MNLTSRKQEAVLRGLLQGGHPPHDVILLEGARQVGKTTLAEMVLKQIKAPSLSLNLERQTLLRSRIDETREFKEFEELLGDELGFDPAVDSVLFIDEAQESLRLGSYVRFMKEAWSGTRVLLSGSTLGRIFKESVRYPVGRVRRLVMRPYTFIEFLRAIGQTHLAEILRTDPAGISPTRHRKLLELLDQYLLVGGLPDAVRAFAAREDHARRRAEIIADYEQDFIRIFGEGMIDIVKGCLRSVSNFVGSPSKNTTVIPQPTSQTNADIRSIFARLENWHLILRSEQRGPSPEASHRFHPKRYLFDTGVLRTLRERAVPAIHLLATLGAAERRPLGGIVENQLAIELSDRFGELAGWKKSSAGLEIDFVVRFGAELGAVPIECKAVLEVKKTHLRGLFGYLESYGQRIGCVVSLAPYDVFAGRGGIQIVNVPLYLAELLSQCVGAGSQPPR